MPVYDYLCTKCGNVDERIEFYDVNVVECSKCNEPAKKIISIRGPNCANETTNWLPSVLEVVDKNSKAPHVVEFIKNPTRQNYKNWMKGEGLRHLEPGEENHPYPKEPDLTKLHKEVWEAHRKRNRLEVRSR